MRARLGVAPALAAQVGEGLAEERIGGARVDGAPQGALAHLVIALVAVHVRELHPHLAVLGG